MIRVLFVCLGNICRSPMAEAILRAKIAQKGLQNQIKVDSAGTGDWHIGSVPHEGTRKILDQYQIDYQGMKARQVSQTDILNFDYLLAMDEQNKKDLLALFGTEQASKIIKLLDFHSGSLKDVPDPYYTGNFAEVYALVEESCEKFLSFLIEEKL